MHKAYSNMPTVPVYSYPKCDKCNHPIVKAGHCYDHADMCDYLYFRDTEAPQIGFKYVDTKDAYYLETVLRLNDVKFYSFQVYGMTSHCLEVFVKEHVAILLNTYYVNEGYAGMSLEEYIKAIS